VNNRRKVRFIGTLLIALFASLFEVAAEPVTLQLKWKHQFQFAGFYMAYEKGYYRDAGIDVRIREVEPDRAAVDELLHGNANYIVVDPGILLARAKGAPVKVLAAVFQHSPLALIVRRDRDIKRISDLRGRRIMMVPGLNADITAALGKAGVSTSDFIRQNTSYNIQDLVDRKTDAFSGYITDQPHQLKLMGVPYRIFHPKDLGIDFYGDILVTSEDEIAQHPARVQAFTEASMRGWQYALDHIDETIDVIMAKYNSQKLPRKQLKFEAEATKHMIESDVVQIGYMREERWQSIAEVYAQQGLLPEGFSVDTLIYRPQDNFIDIIVEHRWLFGLALLLVLLFSLFLHAISLRRAVKSRTMELEESEERFRALFEGNKCVELIIDPESGEIIEANRSAEKFYGYDREQLLAMNISNINMLSAQQISTEMAMAKREHREHFLFRHRLANREIKDVEVYSGPICWNHKMVLYSIIHDVSERKRAEALVNKLSKSIEHAGESFLITDSQGIIEYVNPAFTKITGYPAEEAIGQSPRILKSGKQDDLFYSDMWNIISAGRSWSGKVIDRRKDGRFYPAMLNIAPIMDADGVITHYVSSHTDISELENMEHQFHQAQKMDAIGTLVGGIAHDFNNVLAGMNGSLYLAKQHARDNPEVVYKLESIEQLSFRAADMIKQLLTFARKDQVSMKRFRLNSFIKETLKFLRTSVPEDIEIHQDICSEPLMVNADATQLHQVLMNLVNNACDALESVEKPCISIQTDICDVDQEFLKSHSYFEVGPYAHVSVQDNGSGIPADIIKHLFEPFFTTKEQGKGTGLGLAMVFGAVKTHNGYVLVDSVEGQGTVFHIYIPLLAVDGDDTATPEPDRVIMGEGETILLVDDEENILGSGKEVLESLGYQVLTASNGQQAIDMYKTASSTVSLVILDVVMPVMGGIDAAEHIRRMGSDVKVMFSTGYDKNARGNLEDEAVLSKPFAVAEMSRLIREVLQT